MPKDKGMVAFNQFGFHDHEHVSVIYLLLHFWKLVIANAELSRVSKKAGRYVFENKGIEFHMTFMERIQIDEKQIFNPIWANTYISFKGKTIGNTHRKSIGRPLADNQC